MKITYSAAASLDEFIARTDGDVSWLDDVKIDPNETGMENFFRSIDALVMGRKTYDFVFNYGSWPYEDKPTWVCTHTDVERLPGANLIAVGDIDDVIRQAEARGFKHLWLVGGGRLASSFVDSGLLTHLSISEIPIKLGDGIPLFSDHKMDELACEERTVMEKDRFRQIDITLKHHGDRTKP
ncbi:MAG: dihydrofolate reductase, partial [Planctomycetales bacterium]|nr:dihydrofolate reductase [Planctomycetales bacterium]